MPRVPSIPRVRSQGKRATSAPAPKVSQKPDAQHVKLTTAPQRANRDAVKLPKPPGNYRGPGSKTTSNAKAVTGKTRTWKGK